MINPFNPGAGRRPPYLAGRNDILGSLCSDMERVYEDAEGMRPVVVSGLRGMGKTVLLRDLADGAQRRGWVVLWVEASKDESLAKKLAQAMYIELRRMRTQSSPMSSAFSHALKVLRSFQLKIDPDGAYSVGLDVDPARGFADSGDLSLDLSDLLQAMGEAAREAGTAVFIAIDEYQEAPIEDLRAMNMALHAIGQGASPVPVYFVGAGLPTLPAVLAKASSYAERMYRYYTLDLLDEQAVELAYVEPVESEGMAWEPEALRYAIRAAGGYPYFVQQCGFCICEQFAGPARITEIEALAGIGMARDEVDRGLYRSRWDRATPTAKGMMRAMAQDTGVSALSEVAARMGKNRTSDLSVLRDRLIEDGLIFAPERGMVAFTVPGMDDFVRRMSE